MAEEKLNGKTPAWFQEWHYKHFNSVRDRSKRNERLIWGVFAAVLVANIAGQVTNHWHNEISMLIQRFCGG